MKYIIISIIIAIAGFGLMMMNNQIPSHNTTEFGIACAAMGSILAIIFIISKRFNHD